MQRFKKIFSIAVVLFGILPFTASADITPIPIHFTVVTNDAILFDADITVSECFDTETGTTTSVNAFCAIEQTASTSLWTLATTWYSFGRSLDGINTYTADFVNNRYWIYYTDGAPGFTSLNTHTLTEGEHLTLAYGINPLRITAASSSPEVGTTTMLTGEFFDPILFDWILATGTTFTINGEATSSEENGTLSFIPSTTTPYVISLARDGYIKSAPVSLTPYVSDTSSTTATSSDPTPAPSPSQGGSATPEATHTIDTGKAVAFLRSLQSADGSFGVALYTDWVAIGLSGVSGADDIRAKLVSYMKTNTDPGSLLTDLERRAMALEALGIDPSLGTSRDYIKEMLLGFDGTQWGNVNEVNDDIFALIPLMHAGYSTSDDAVMKTVATIVAAQSSTGSWGSIDLTAAGITALAPAASLPGVVDAIAKAKAYLHSAEGTDGGFGSSFATSWVLQAISGEDLAQNWMKNGKTPQDYLWLLQQADGGIESSTVDTQSRVWATAYAIPAASGKDWNALLGVYPRSAAVPVVVFGSTGGSSGEVLGTTTLATTTVAATSTSATSSLQIAVPTLTTVSITSTTTASTSIEIKKDVSQPKKVIVKKVVTPPLPDLVSSVTVSSTTQIDPPKTSWTDVVTKPFARLFKSLRSWFD